MDGGRGSGAPNLYWRSLREEQLRGHPSFVALPHPEKLVLTGASTSRFVRQSSQLWTDLHEGVLTTGSLKEALGFREERAGKVIRVEGQTSHRHLLSVYQNLRRSSSAYALLGRDPPHHAEVTAQNEALVASYNAALRAAAAASAAAGGKGLDSGRAAEAVGVGRSVAEVAADDCYCQKLAAAGDLQRVRMAWGSLHEASALHALMALMPQSTVYEVGLFRVNVAALPKEWCFSESDLPPLGASPDGMIEHNVRAPRHRADWLAAAEATLTRQGGSASPAQLTQLRFDAMRATRELLGLVAVACPGSCERPDGDVQVAAAAAVQVREGKDQEEEKEEEEDDDEEEMVVEQGCGAQQGPASQTKPTPSLLAAATDGAVAPASASASAAKDAGEGIPSGGQEATSSAAPQPGGGGSLGDVCSMLEYVRLAFQQTTAAQPASLALQQPQQAQPKQQQKAAAAATSAVSGAVSSRPAVASSGAAAAASPSGGGSGTADETAETVVRLREVVEIKNSCPFGAQARRSGAKGKLRTEFVLSDRGPRDRVPPHWVPQLQLHMLAAGVRSGLLVSRSASKGVRIFRMYRDDDYLYRLLRVVSELYTCHVLPGQPPPPDVFFDQPRYRGFLQATVRLAASAEVVVDCQEALVPPGCDTRAFV